MYGAQIAFRNYNFFDGMWGSEWVGFQQFTKFFRSYQFERVFWNTIRLSFYLLLFGFPFPIILALLLNNSRRGRLKKTVQMATYAPYFISVVVLSGIIIQFLSPKFGILNNVRAAAGLDRVAFLNIPRYFGHIFVWSEVWKASGWQSIIYMSALSTVDPSLYESARVEGASRLRIMWHIDLPSIMPTIVTLLILNAGRVLNIGYEKILNLQNPLNLQASEVIQTFVYKVGIASSLPNYSYATAIGLFRAAINFALLIIVNRIARRLGETSLW
jgi:multiple sugar transport system permease protein/putative aldouronate transport system permease protein